MSGIAPTQPIPFVNGLDCSPEAQAERLRRLRELEGIFYSGSASLTDRNRSVTFASRKDLGAAILLLRNELNACLGNRRRQGGRMFYVPQEKGL